MPDPQSPLLIEDQQSAFAALTASPGARRTCSRSCVPTPAIAKRHQVPHRTCARCRRRRAGRATGRSATSKDVALRFAMTARSRSCPTASPQRNQARRRRRKAQARSGCWPPPPLGGERASHPTSPSRRGLQFPRTDADRLVLFAPVLANVEQAKQRDTPPSARRRAQRRN